MDQKIKPSSNIPHHVNEKIIRIDEKLDRLWDILLHMSDNVIKIKYAVQRGKEDQ